MPTMNHADLNEMLSKHQLFVESSGESGEEIDLSDLHIGHTEISEIDLSEVYALETTFENCTFVEVDFYASNLSKSKFKNCTIISCNFSKANFHGASIENSTFSDSKLSQANFINANFDSCDFNKCDISHSIFMSSKIHDTTFTSTLAEGIDLKFIAESNEITGSTTFNTIDTSKRM